MLKPIVLVEDCSNDAELTLVALENARLANEVVVLRDGMEALHYLCCDGPHECREKGNPALILLDIKLPKIDGLEVLECVRRRPELKVVPIVMLTSSAEDSDLKRGYELGANGYVVKPVGFHDFLAAVQGLGGYWAVFNEPPPGTKKPSAHNANKKKLYYY